MEEEECLCSGFELSESRVGRCFGPLFFLPQALEL